MFLFWPGCFFGWSIDFCLRFPNHQPTYSPFGWIRPGNLTNGHWNDGLNMVCSSQILWFGVSMLMQGCSTANHWLRASEQGQQVSVSFKACLMIASMSWWNDETSCWLKVSAEWSMFIFNLASWKDLIWHHPHLTLFNQIESGLTQPYATKINRNLSTWATWCTTMSPYVTHITSLGWHWNRAETSELLGVPTYSATTHRTSAVQLDAKKLIGSFKNRRKKKSKWSLGVLLIMIQTGFCK